MKLDPNFSAFARCLNSSKVEWLVVWIGRDKRNAIAMVHAVESFGFGALGLQIEDFLGRAALVANKEATGWLQDLADAERLRQGETG